MAKKKPDNINEYYNPNNSRTFRDGDQGSDNLANNHFQFLEFFHLPSSYFVAFKAYKTCAEFHFFYRCYTLPMKRLKVKVP